MREFLSLFFATLFVMPFPSRLRCLSPFANLRVAANGSMHFSLILFPLRFNDSTEDSQMALARCYTPVSVIRLPLRSSSNIELLSFKFLIISLTC